LREVRLGRRDPGLHLRQRDHLGKKLGVRMQSRCLRAGQVHLSVVIAPPSWAGKAPRNSRAQRSSR
jgi:hypothetical protein